MKDKYLVVSIHDVTPEFKQELTTIVSELDKIGIKKTSVLIIPNYYENKNLVKDNQFTDWLYQLYDNGNELVQHGYNHLCTNYNFKSHIQKFIGTKINHSEGEFQNISYDEAKSKIQKGKDIFNTLGLTKLISKGFVAPAWLLNQESEKAIKDAGFDYYTTFRHINFPKQKKKEKSEAIVFTSGNGFANKMFALYNHDLTHRVFKNRRIARITIHPKDLHSNHFDSVLDSIKKVRKGREIITYADLIPIIKNEN